MCGRTACTLNPENLRRACQYKGKDGKVKKPDWKDAPCGNQYFPSTNIPPTVYTPVLIGKAEERLLQPMMWGLVPPWHKGCDPKSHGLSTNNARLEGVKDSKLYSSSLSRRCVVVADGFYEWKRDGEVKQPYLVYVKQEEGVRIEHCGSICDDDLDSEWSGPKLTYMAGIYSKWEGPDGWPIFSYSILTRESNPVLSWLHHRMPCFLHDDESVSTWLDSSLTSSQALDSLQLPSEGELCWHTVSSKVGNSRNKDMDLVKEVAPQEKKENKVVQASAASKNLMSNWLKRSSGDKLEKDVKKSKSETPSVP